MCILKFVSSFLCVDIKFQMPQDNNSNESFDLTFHSLTLTKFHSAADDNYFNRNEEQISYRPQDVQINNLKLYESPEKQTLTSVSQLRNNLFIQTQKEDRSQDLNLVEYTDTREHFYNKQGSGGNRNKNPSKNNSINYITEKNSQIKCNATQCSTPEICAAVFKSAININNRHDFNNTRNLRSNVDLNRNLGQSLYVTSSSQSDKNRKLTYPYRTVSHFGFNWPLQDPQPEHKHVTVNFDDKQKYIPLKRTVSYEEIFSTSRYLDLCEYCFEHIVRSKPEIMRYTTKLRNLFEKNCALYPHTKTSIEKCCLPSTNTNNEYGNKSLDLNCYKFETYDSNTVFPFQLDKVIEIDESFNDYLHAQFIPTSTFNEQTHCATCSETDIKGDIYSVPYSRRSTSPEISLLSADNIHLRQQNHNLTTFGLDMSVNNYNENKLNNTSMSCCNSNESNSNNFFTEIWKLSNLPNTSTDTSQNEKLCESSVNPKKLMNREERWRRKLEFQEIWEDHVIFAQNREYDMELVNGTSQNISIIKSLEKNKEIYDGCCVLFPNCSFTNNKLLDNSHFQQLFNKQDNMPLKIMEENNINSVCNNNINLSNNAYTLKCPEEIENDPLTILTNDKNKGEFVKNSETSNVFINEHVCVSEVCEVNEENCIEKNSNNSNENCADFSPLERKILEKIQIINSNKEDAILSKIENSIRNKITPHKLQSLLKEKTLLKNRGHKDKEKENLNFLNKINCIKPVGRARLLNSNKNYTSLRPHKINKVQLSLTESNKQVLKVTRSDRHNNSISPHSKNFIKTEKLKRRNFILENIRNASTPRQTYHAKTDVDQKLQTQSSCSSFDKVPNLKKVSKSLVHSVETPHFILSKKRKVPTDIYSFQSKLVKGSPRFWISLPQSSTTKFEESSSSRDRTFTNTPSSCTMAILPHNIDTGSATKVDTELNALGEEIQKIQPRLESYKRKLDDFGDRVTECFHNINECVSTHEKTISEQQNLKDHIVLHQYAENVMCNIQTFSLSETED